MRDLETMVQFNDVEEVNLPTVCVELASTTLATLYASSPRSAVDFPDYNEHIRTAISLGRRFQNAEQEFASFFNQDDEILQYNWHPLQDQLAPSDLRNVLTQELMTVVNRSGVNINHAVVHPHIAATLPFVAGFGQRKARELINVVKLDGRGRIFSRRHLYDLDFRVWGTCSGTHMRTFRWVQYVHKRARA